MITILDNQNLLDWFDAQTNTGIVHQANCQHTMGAGIARQIRARYPEAYEADLGTLCGDRKKLGTFSLAFVKNSQTRFIYNLYSQYSIGGWRDTSYDAMVDGLERVKKDAVAHDILSHHGRREFGSPVAPKSKIAWLLHLCDGISARMDDADKMDVVNKL